MRERPGVMRGIAGTGKFTARAHRPVPLVRKLSEHLVEYRDGCLAVADDETALVQVHHGDIVGARLAAQARANLRAQLGELSLIGAEEVDEPASVDRDQPGLTGAGFRAVSEWGEKVEEDVVVGPAPVVLAAA